MNTLSHSKLAQSLYPHSEHMPGKRSTENEAESAKTRFRICVNLDLKHAKLFVWDNSNTLNHSKLAQSLYPHPEDMPGQRSTENEGQRARNSFQDLRQPHTQILNLIYRIIAAH